MKSTNSFIALMFGISAGLAGCTAAQLATIEAEVAAGQALIVPAEGLACMIAGMVDAAHASVVCAQIDAAGNVIAQLPPVIEVLASATAIVKAHPASDAQKAKMFGTKVKP